VITILPPVSTAEAHNTQTSRRSGSSSSSTTGTGTGAKSESTSSSRRTAIAQGARGDAEEEGVPESKMQSPNDTRQSGTIETERRTGGGGGVGTGLSVHTHSSASPKDINMLRANVLEIISLLPHSEALAPHTTGMRYFTLLYVISTCHI